MSYFLTYGTRGSIVTYVYVKLNPVPVLPRAQSPKNKYTVGPFTLFGTAGAAGTAEQSVNLSISNRNKVQLQAVPGGRVCDQRSAHSAGV